VRSVVEVSTTESKVGGYIEIKGSTFEDATEGITFTSLTIGGVSIPVTATSSNGYTVYSSSKIGVWLPQGVKTGDIVVTTSRGTDNWGRTFTILPPGQVSWVGATPGDEEIGLRWVNPTQDEAGTLDSALYGTMLLRSQTSMALNSFIPINEYTGYTVDTETNPGSGIYVVYDGTAVSSLTDDGLTNGVTYYYRAITHDLAGHYNSTTANATACATPVDTSTVSAPQIDDVYGWLTGSVTTREVRVGAKIAISGSYLGTGTAEVTVNGVAATYVETQSEYYLKVIVPETVAGTATVKVRNTTTGLYDEATITILPPAAVNYFGLAATGSGWISYSLSDNCGYTESSYI
jgi:hypothetical protein